MNARARSAQLVFARAATSAASATALGEIRTEIAAQLPQREADVAALEAELATTRGEQKRLAKASR